MSRQEAKEVVGWCVLLPAAALPFTLLGALAVLLLGIVVVWWK